MLCSYGAAPASDGLPWDTFSWAAFALCVVWGLRRCGPLCTNPRWGSRTGSPKRAAPQPFSSRRLWPDICIHWIRPLIYPVGLVLIALGVALTFIFVPRSQKLPPERIELAPDL